MKAKYRFSHSYINSIGVKILVWQSVTRPPGDSRVEQIICSAQWFWGPPRPAKPVFYSRRVRR